MREIITSMQNAKVKHWIKLNEKKYRLRHNEFIIEGKNIIYEAKKLNLIKTIITSNENNDEGILVSYPIIQKISNSKIPSNTIAIAKLPKPLQSYGNFSKVLILNNLQDPGNVGTLIRTAVAFDYELIVVEGVDPFCQKVVRATQGTIFKINILNMESSIFLEKFNGFKIASSSTNKSSKKYNEIKVPSKFCIILGNEGNGVESKILNIANVIVQIPTLIDSLNVAQAGAILLNEYKQ